jgi:hypothetical protein
MNSSIRDAGRKLTSSVNVSAIQARRVDGVELAACHTAAGTVGGAVGEGSFSTMAGTKGGVALGDGADPLPREGAAPSRQGDIQQSIQQSTESVLK